MSTAVPICNNGDNHKPYIFWLHERYIGLGTKLKGPVNSKFGTNGQHWAISSEIFSIIFFLLAFLTL